MGLTDLEVIESRKKYGSNVLTKPIRESFLKKYLSSLGDPIIRILLIALGIKVIFLLNDFDWYETIGIVIAIFIASFISTISEIGSEKAFDKLQEENSKLFSRVKRNGNIVEINSDDIVKNDILLLQSGERICADGILISGEIHVDESIINGESTEVFKFKNSKVFRGTIVCDGECVVKVCNVGDSSYYGMIAQELHIDSIDSPLKVKLLHLAKIISRIGYVCSFTVALSYLFNIIFISNNFNYELIVQTISNPQLMFGYVLHALTLSVTIIVVSVPEGLPMMITLVLSSNMKKMLKNNVLVRKLSGIETAGGINILFTDKTGTLTKGNLQIIEIMVDNNIKYNKITDIKKNTKLYDYICMSFCANNSSNYNDKAIGGNSTDRAFLNYIGDKINYHILSYIPFNSKNKFSSCVVENNGGKYNLVKGAPEIVLEKCLFYYDLSGKKKLISSKKNLIKQICYMTEKGYRPISCLIDNVLVCTVFMKDEIKKETIEGLYNINKASISTVMITGDNKETATAIGKEIGLVSDDGIILTSSELNKITDVELERIIPKLNIVARALPTDKSRLIKVCQNMGLVVGMTGDGVNDAPALKRADVGFCMGSGTEVAKEASDIVIMDDNLLSISKAILFGRTIFKSIRKFVVFQLTVNLCAVSLSIIGPFIGYQSPVTVIQMLWINMVMDTLAGLAFSFEPPLQEYLSEKPLKRDTMIINKYMFGEIIFTGLYSSLLCIFFLESDLIRNFFGNDDYFMTGFFGLFIFISIFNCFNARTHRLNIFANLSKNIVFIIIICFITIIQLILIYYGGKLFRTTGLSFLELITMIIISFTVVPVDWIRKIFLKKYGLNSGV